MARGRIVTAICLFVVLALPTMRAAGSEQDDLVQKIQTAKTAADHEALAARYEQQAAKARAEADLHKQMEGAYGAGASTGKGLWVPMPQHCATLVKSNENSAKEYEAMAAAHREMAKSAAK